jgi:hypothetical protein
MRYSGKCKLTLPPECVSLKRLVLGDIHPRRRRGGGNVGIATGDFQGLGEGWEKQFHRFSHAFQQTVNSTAS